MKTAARRISRLEASRPIDDDQAFERRERHLDIGALSTVELALAGAAFTRATGARIDRDDRELSDHLHFVERIEAMSLEQANVLGLAFIRLGQNRRKGGGSSAIDFGESQWDEILRQRLSN